MVVCDLERWNVMEGGGGSSCIFWFFFGPNILVAGCKKKRGAQKCVMQKKAGSPKMCKWHRNDAVSDHK